MRGRRAVVSESVAVVSGLSGMKERRRKFDWSGLRERPAGQKRADSSSGSGRYEAGAAAPVVPPQTSLPATDRVSGPHDRVRSEPFMLRVNDLKQYAYCPRIVFYQYVLPVQRKPTFKMEHGKAVEPRVEQLEHRRKLRSYGLSEGKRRFRVPLTSHRLGLTGRLDLLIRTPGAAYPVDFKDTLAPVRHNHHVQLCAYAMLVEAVEKTPVPVGFIYRVPRQDVVPVEMVPTLYTETEQHIASIRQMILTERMPPPTPIRARCEDCEYRNYCGDIF